MPFANAAEPPKIKPPTDDEQVERLREGLREAHDAADQARRTIAAIAREMGFPLTRSLRPEERHDARTDP